MSYRPDEVRVLIADDNQDAAETLARLLRELQYEVRVATNGRSAYEIALEFQPQAGIFDLGMPGLTGYELARYVRLEPWGREAVLIALSGFADHADRAKADHAGFTHYLAKPAEFSDLSQLLPRPSRGNPRHAPGVLVRQSFDAVRRRWLSG
jgi:CheY-like chemotaxis protein